jgi:hypothetical protein
MREASRQIFGLVAPNWEQAEGCVARRVRWRERGIRVTRRLRQPQDYRRGRIHNGVLTTATLLFVDLV